MTETKGICDCINYSDKFDIEVLISKDIDELNDRLKKVENDRKDLEKFGADPDKLLAMYESQKSKLKNFLLKVKNTPECKPVKIS